MPPNNCPNGSPPASWYFCQLLRTVRSITADSTSTNPTSNTSAFALVLFLEEKGSFLAHSEAQPHNPENPVRVYLSRRKKVFLSTGSFS
jgi:hypothetical protein